MGGVMVMTDETPGGLREEVRDRHRVATAQAGQHRRIRQPVRLALAVQLGAEAVRSVQRRRTGTAARVSRGAAAAPGHHIGLLA